MSAYDDLYVMVSRTVWDAFKSTTPDADQLKFLIGQYANLNINMLPQFAEFKEGFDMNAFVESMAKEYWAKSAVRQSEGNYLFASEEYEPWLPDAEDKGEIEWHYWNQYRRYLEHDMGWSREVCDTISKDTKEILALTHNPSDELFTTKGAGHWQCPVG